MPFISHTPAKKICTSSEHRPPSHIVLEPGTHVWECPACLKETVVTVPLVEYKPYFGGRAIYEENSSTNKDWKEY